MDSTESKANTVESEANSTALKANATALKANAIALKANADESRACKIFCVNFKNGSLNFTRSKLMHKAL